MFFFRRPFLVCPKRAFFPSFIYFLYFLWMTKSESVARWDYIIYKDICIMFRCPSPVGTSIRNGNAFVMQMQKVVIIIVILIIYIRILAGTPAIYMPLYIHMHSITFLRDLRLFFFLLCSRHTLTDTAAAVSFGNPTKKCHRLLYCCHCDIVKKIYYNTVQKRVFVDYSAPYYNLYRTRKTISYIVM